MYNLPPLIRNPPAPPCKMTSLPPSKLIVPPSKLIVPPSRLIMTIFASEAGFLMRGVIVPPSKLIVTNICPLQGGVSY